MNKEIKFLHIPEHCPICHGKTELVTENSSTILVCTNDNCKGKLLGRLTHFVSKNAINIENLSEATIEKFIELGWLTCFKDIFTLKDHFTEMVKLDGFGEKSVKKLLDSIEKSKNTTLDRFIYSLSINLIGKSASKDIAIACDNGDIQKFVDIMNSRSKTPFIDLNGFGKAMCESLLHWWINNKEMFYKLTDNFNFIKKEDVKNNLNLSGKIFAITGSLEHYKNRDELIFVIESLGGKVSNNVSAKTDFLINNDVKSNSSKNQKARKLDVEIISEIDFIKMIEN